MTYTMNEWNAVFDTAVLYINRKLTAKCTFIVKAIDL
jgi:hypothetical protein